MMSEFKKRFNRWKKGEKVYEAGRKLPEVVITPDEEYNAYLNTLPDNQRLTPNEEYDQKRYWELGGKPKDFDEAIKREMFSLVDDGYYHANSVRKNQDGDYEFMKPNTHPTKWMEDEFYENDEQFQKQYRRTFDWTRPGFSKYERNINPLDHINLPKYDTGTSDKTYLPEYEYEATVTPQGTSVEKHKRITNEEDWQKYWGNVGAGYVNKAQNEAAPYVLNGMSMLMGNPIGAFAGIAGGIVGEDIGAHWGPAGRTIGGLVGGIMSDNLINIRSAFNPGLFKTKATNTTPNVTRFYHGSPVRFDTFDAAFIGSGEGGSKVMKGINLWPKEKIGNAPKFANIKSPDAPLHLGVSSTPLGGELNPTVYDVSGKGLKLYKAAPIEIKSLNQEDLIKQGYDGVQTSNQVTVFPESISKLSIDKQSSIEDFVMSHPEVERWTPWTTDGQKMQNIINTSKISKWTPEQWTAAQDAAIARGDMAEAQKLRDLHFKVSAPNTKVVNAEGNPRHVYHGGAKNITQFLNPNEFDANIRLNNYYRNGKNRVGIYTSDWKSYANQYARGYKKKDRNIYDLYTNMENPRYVSYWETKLNELRNLNPFRKRDYLNPSIIRPEHKEELLKGYDGVKWDIENVVFDGKQLKSADAVTYDDNGVRIPLGDRDNFNINDIRYALAPLLLGGTTAGYWLKDDSGYDKGKSIKPVKKQK